MSKRRFASVLPFTLSCALAGLLSVGPRGAQALPPEEQEPPPAPPAVAPAPRPVAPPAERPELRVFGGVDLLILEREDPGPDTLWTTDPPNPEVLFGANDFQFDVEPGVQGHAGFLLGRLGAEISGFWISNFLDRKQFRGRAGPCCQIDTTPSTGFDLDADEFQEARYDSELHGIEGNVLFELVPGAILLGGLRWIDLDEKLRFESKGLFEVNTWDVENQMIGPQLGARFEVFELVGLGSSPFSLASDIRVAALFTESETTFKNARGGADDPFGHDKEDEVGAGIQSGLHLGFEPIDGVVFHVGYQVLWLSRVATASRQIGGTGSFTADGRTGVDTRHEDVLYHGGVIGVTIALP